MAREQMELTTSKVQKAFAEMVSTIEGTKDDKGGKYTLKYFFCEGPCKARDCLKKTKLYASVEEQK